MLGLKLVDVVLLYNSVHALYWDRFVTVVIVDYVLHVGGDLVERGFGCLLFFMWISILPVHILF